MPILMVSTSSFHQYSSEVPFALSAALLQRCSSSSAAATRKAHQLHALIVTTTPPSSPPFIFNTLLSIYYRCGRLGDARQMFDRMPHRSVVSYNSMISAYSKSARHAIFALQFFRDMAVLGLRPNASTLSSLIRASSTNRDRRSGAAVHSLAVVNGFCNNVCVQTALLGMYSDCGGLEAANSIFGEMVERDVIAWNSIIFSNVRNGSVEGGLQLCRRMVMDGLIPNNCTISIALNACARIGDCNRGRIAHAQAILSEFAPDVPLQNALIGMYASCGDLDSARSVFDRIEPRDLVSWNSLMAGYSNSGNGEGAFNVFVRLRGESCFRGPLPDEYTFATVVSATAALSSRCYGKPLHAQVKRTGLEHSVYVGNTLINMYFVNDDPDSARKLFMDIPERDSIIWTEMIVGHSALGECESAINYFCHMLGEGHRADSFSLSSAVSSSADLVALKQGEMIHTLALKAGYEENMCVAGSLVNMYAKNGILESARFVFANIANPDLQCWNALIGGYGSHGDAERAFELFNKMVGRGLQPDHVTYVSLLSACSHCIMVERGRFFWFCMTTDGIMPGLKHYTCMATLLGRAGRLQEAEELIAMSPFAESSPELWRILLSSCVVFRDLELGVYAAGQALRLEPDDGATHILLSNLYASVGRWDDMAEVRRRIRGMNVEKDQGLSWIESRNLVHVFAAADDTHHQVAECRDELLRLQRNLKGEPEALEGMVFHGNSQEGHSFLAPIMGVVNV